MDMDKETFVALASVGAWRCVAPAAAAGGQRRCQLWTTNSMSLIGVSQDNASTAGSVRVCTRFGDIVRVICDASVSSGAFVGPLTATGGITERVMAGTTTGWNYTILGIATEAGSTNSVINVVLQPQSFHLNV